MGVQCGRVEMEIELCGWKPPAGGAESQKRMFDPPLSQQRYELVFNLLRAADASTVVDLGCGDGKLLEYIYRRVCHCSGLKLS